MQKIRKRITEQYSYDKYKRWMLNIQINKSDTLRKSNTNGTKCSNEWNILAKRNILLWLIARIAIINEIQRSNEMKVKEYLIHFFVVL